MPASAGSPEPLPSSGIPWSHPDSWGRLSRADHNSPAIRSESARATVVPLERPLLYIRTMLRLNVTLRAASPRNAENLLEGLQYQVPSTRLEHGCLGCDAWVAADSTVRYCEDWATENDLRRRVQSDRFTSLLAVVEAAADASVQFDFVNQTRGLDYVVELREQAASESRPFPPPRPPGAR